MAEENSPQDSSQQKALTFKTQLKTPVEEINREFKEKACAEKAKKLGIGYVDIVSIPINPDLLYLLKPEEAKKALVMPFFRIGKRLRLALADLEKTETKDILVYFRDRGYALNLNLATDDGILETIDHAYKAGTYKVEKPIVNIIEEKEIQTYEKEIKNLTQMKEKFEKITSEEALNFLNVGAIKTGASDIHYQQEEDKIAVRFRIDGVLQKIFDLDLKVFKNIANQLKYKARMKLNIQNEPQDGRFSFVVNKRKIDVRVSSLPTPFGESFVCRFLDPGGKFFELDELGFTGRNLELLKKASGISHGMILVTGPTGSGKTTTLYSLIQRFNKPEKKIITLEDPIEYHLDNVTQSQINEKRGYDFANGLRSLLRHDPDVVMIGEIRDLSTAEVCAQAALTGHVLLTTLHTNSAIETIPRLANIGLPHFMISPSLHTIVAQRLVRRICPKCHIKKPISRAAADEISRALNFIREISPEDISDIPKELPVASEEGCEFCSHTGYKGRIAIGEIVQVDFSIKDLILNKASTTKLIEAARSNGMVTMREDGILKALAGITTLEEVHRVTNVVV